jgi:diketogulonate reductase-like aldo/keto reductase
MKTETVHNVTLPKIGYGAWKIGGDTQPRPEWDDRSLAALHSALAVGYTHFDTAEYYAKGHSEELIGRALRERNVRREDVFITSKVSPSHLSYNALIKACENSLRNLGTDYLDMYLIHWPSASMDLEDAFRAMNQLVNDKLVKYLGVSNFNLRQLKQSQKLSETPIVTNQVPYSLTDRSYVKSGMLEYCQENDILLTAYSPLDEGKLEANPKLEAIAKAHNATIFQIALAWLAMQPRVITIPMSYSLRHIQENFRAGDIDLTKTEMRQLNNL